MFRENVMCNFGIYCVLLSRYWAVNVCVWRCIFLLLNLHPKVYILSVCMGIEIINHWTTSGSRKRTANAYNERKLCYIRRTSSCKSFSKTENFVSPSWDGGIIHNTHFLSILQAAILFLVSIFCQNVADFKI